MTQGINRVRVRIADVVDATVEVSGLTHQLLLSDRRLSDLVYWRQRSWVAAYHLTGQSLTALGRHYGRDHTTVLYALKKCRQALDPSFVADITRIAERAIEIAEMRGLLRRAA